LVFLNTFWFLVAEALFNLVFSTILWK